MVRLRAEVGDYVAKMQRAQKATADMSKSTKNMSRETADNFATIGAPVAAAGAALAGGFGMAVKAAADFEKQMSGVRAAVGKEGAAAMQQLADAALDAGQKTSFSATEAARAQEELAKAGISTADILGGALTGSLSLAAAGQLDLGRAAELSAQAMNIFKLRGADVGRIADVLANGANKSATDVNQLGEALKMGGLVAQQTGLTLEDTVGALSMFAQNALEGSDAGTSLKTMLGALTPSSAEASRAMQDIGFSAFDAQGKFIGMEGVARELQEGMRGMTDETRLATMETIFGSDAVRAASILYEQGAEGVKQWTDNVRETGAAADTAATKMDNLAGDMERLSGSLETAFIKGGTAVTTGLRGSVQAVEGLVNAYSELPGPVQGATTVLAGVGGAAGLAGGGLLLTLPRLIETREAMKSLADSGSRVPGVLGKIGRAGAIGATLGVLTVALSALGDEIDRLTGRGAANMDAMTKAMLDFSNSGDLTGEAARVLGADMAIMDEALSRLGNPGKWERLEQFGDRAVGWVAPFSTATERMQTSVKGFDGALAGLLNSGNADTAAALFEDLRVKAEGQGVSLEQLKSLFPQYSGALDAAAVAAEGAAKGTGAAAGAIEGLPGAVDGAVPAVEQLTDAQKKYNETLAGFIQPLDAYTSLLAEKEQAEQRTAEKTAAATESQEDSWEDYVKAVDVSVEEYLQKLREQVTAQENWQLNMTKLSSRVSQDTIDALAEMGIEGAPLVAKLVDATDAELLEMERLFAKRTQDAANKQQQVLRDAAPYLRVIASQLGKGAADAAATELQKGVSNIETIALRYGTALQSGLFPLYQSLGIKLGSAQALSFARRDAASARTGRGNALGDVYDAHQPEIAPGGAWRVWAEPETGGEAYIPLRNDHRRPRALAIWEETGRRLGVSVDNYATGGLPAPPSLRPYEPPLTPPPEAGMRAAYNRALEMMAPAAGSAGGPQPLGVQKMMSLLNGAFGAVRLISGLRPGAITATGRRSYHGMGRAVDIPPSMAYFNWIAQNFPNSRELIFSPAGGRQINNGRPHVYTGITRSMHWDHVHWAMAKGGILNPHVRDSGGPLLPGFTYNGTGRPEAVVPMAAGGIIPAGISVQDRAYLAGGLALTMERVRAIFQNRGVQIATAMESVEQRLRRIAEDLRAGTRSFAQIRASVSGLARSGNSAVDLAYINAGFDATIQRVHQIFENRGVAIATSSETAIQRLGRIAHEVTMGLRTMDDVRRSVVGLTNGGVRAVGGRLQPYARPGTVEEAQKRIDEYQQQIEALDRMREREAALRDLRAATTPEDHQRALDRLGMLNQQEARAERLLALERQLNDVRQADERAQFAKGRLDALRDMLTEQARIVEEMTRAEREMRKSAAELVRGRAEELRAWADLSQPVTVRWGNTLGALTRNIGAQVAQFEEWTRRLAAARRAGVSEAVIDALGLDKGPEALGQLREFGRASTAEIRALNEMIARQQTVARTQAEREAGQPASELNQKLAELTSEFTTRQTEMLKELQGIGQDGALRYGDAIAQGLRSSIPAIQAQARLVQQAMQGLDVDRAVTMSGDADLTARIRDIFRNRGVRIATATESEAARLARIVGEVKAGRSLDSVRTSVSAIAQQRPSTSVTGGSTYSTQPVGGSQTIIVQLDGKTIAQTTTAYQQWANRTLTIRAGS